MPNLSGSNNPCYRHGYALRGHHHPLYDVLRGMKNRCLNKNTPRYSDYGGRGITICDEWMNNTAAFILWGEQNGYEKGLHIDNDSGYSPDNCRFIKLEENNRNRRIFKNTGRFIGVRLRDRMTSYTAQINHNGNVRIGTYTNEIDAAVARDSYFISNKLNRRLNFSQPITEIK